MKNLPLAASALVLSLITTAAPAHAASFQVLATLPGDGYSVPAGGISGDGSTVVGYSRTADYSGTNHAWKWTAATGTFQITAFQVADGVSYDGSAIIGNTGTSGYLLSSAGLTPLPGTPSRITGDASVVVGTTGDVGYRWTSSGTTLIPPVSGAYSPANGVSSDGSIVVGQCKSATSNYIAYKWTAATGTVAITTGVGAAGNSAGNAVSDDGSVVAGFTLVGGSGSPAVWTAATGWQPTAVSSSFGSASDITPDGRYVVGSDDGGAFIWDAVHGERYIANILTAEGVNLGGLSLKNATGISDDGTIITGLTYDNGLTVPWVADIAVPEPASLALLAPTLLLALHRTRRLRPASRPT